MAQIVDTRSVAALIPHPQNAAIYGDYADAELVESVRAKGILNPLLVTRDGRIVSGHRRWDAAQKVGLADVPVVVFGSDDEIDIVDALLESNRNRVKTGEQIGREYDASKAIEAGRAKLRQQEHGGTAPGRPSTLVVNSPQVKKPAPKAGDRAAVRIGVSRQKAERAATVVKVIDELTETGKAREAEQLRATLNGKSVNRAYERARDAGYVRPQQTPAPPALIELGLEKQLVTLQMWHELTDDQKAQVLARPRSRDAKFNSQANDNIEWAMWSWNPVTGCKHDCSYCYARDIAARHYSQGFVPTFLPERLSAPRNTLVPSRAAEEPGYRNVFTCSMADLFGRWVPAEWIDAVLTEVRANPQWHFLFLTKFPIRLQEFDFPDNAWVGTTVDAQARVANAERAFAKVKAKVKWLSCEPLLEPLRFEHLDLFQWVVIGGSSRSTQTPEWRPPRSWVEHIERQARDANCKVYEKTNLLERLREYPGQPEPEHISVPDAFKMPYLQRDVLDPQEYEREHAALVLQPQGGLF